MKKKNSDLINNDVTLLLTIFNRRQFTLRWIDFIEKFNCPFNIYISDGGNDKLLQKKLEKIAKKNKKITYKKFTYYKNYKNFFEKYYLSTKEIKTKYTYICEDDDFLINFSAQMLFPLLAGPETVINPLSLYINFSIIISILFRS